MVNQKYWHTKQLLEKTGALDKPAPIKVTEKIGAGVLNANGVAVARGKRGMAGSAMFEQYIDTTTLNRYKKGHTQRVDLSTGMQNIQLDFNSMNMIKQSLSVYKNGGESLVEGADYTIDYQSNTLRLTRPAKGTDDDIEIRCQIDTTDDHTINHVLLLPRKMGNIEFEMDQLADLLPNTGDIFEVDKLLKYNNTALVPHAGGKLQVVEAGITDEGIRGKMLII